MNNLEELKCFLKSKNIGDLVLRREIMDLRSYSGCTMDAYRRRLTILGYLDHVGRGIYKKMKEIPDDFATKDSMYAYKNRRVKL